MATFKDKISNLLNSQVPDFVLEDHPLFLDFVKAYYKFLESAEITLTNIGDPDHLQLDNQTNAINFIQLNGTNINGDDDGEGNVRRYRLVGQTRTYANNTQGTITYSTGQIVLNSLNISSIENIRDVASTVIELTVEPNSNDIVPVRNQVLEIDVANSTINVEADALVGGSANAGIGYTTTSSYN